MYLYKISLTEYIQVPAFIRHNNSKSAYPTPGTGKDAGYKIIYKSQTIQLPYNFSIIRQIMIFI
jgi:hypothetical protein